MKIRKHYSKVDYLIAFIRSITHRNKRMQNKFSIIWIHPDVIIKDGEVGSNQLFILLKICLQFGGILLERAKEAVNNVLVISELMEIKFFYEILIQVLNNFEKSIYNIRSGYNSIINLNFKKYLVAIKSYILQRFSTNNAESIALMNNSLIFPAEYAFLGNCPQTSILADRSFKNDNIPKYFFCYYNSVDQGEDSNRSDISDEVLLQ